MLSLAMRHTKSAGWNISNVDVTVIAEQPKISEFRDAMRAAVARVLDVDVAQVSIKGKTNEGMGWIGRGEGLACLAIATIVRDTR